ncbi:hypothetical protein [Vibrio metschnikovii]|uniref:hypothetical protein n=1 Tax=Vibrio metschnikovii TaxID=28172 RepID=UPI001C302961|nr:hypothetical protein [Vibrio metschnikovii]
MPANQQNSIKRSVFVSACWVMIGTALSVEFIMSGLKGELGPDLFSILFDAETWENSAYKAYWHAGSTSIALILALLCLRMGSRSIEGLFELRVSFDKAEIKRAGQAILFIVSPMSPNYKLKQRSGHLFLCYNNRHKSGDSRCLRLTKDLKLDIDNISKLSHKKNPFNWQQQMRGLHAHVRHDNRVKLQQIALVGSIGFNGQPGSHQQLHLLETLLSIYLPSVSISKHEANFLCYEELCSLLKDIVEQTNQKGISDNNIYIDVTGGTKTASIAAADATLHNKSHFQYVDTGTSDVYSYQISGARGV